VSDAIQYNGEKKSPLSYTSSPEGSRDFMKIVTTAKQYLVHLTMKKLEELLPADRNIRTHKSNMVALDKIRIVKTDELLLKNQQTIPVSINYKEQVLKSFSRSS